MSVETTGGAAPAPIPRNTESGSSSTTTGINSTFTAWTDLITSLASNMTELSLTGTVNEASGAVTTLDMEIGKGPNGSEVRIGTIQCRLLANSLVPLSKTIFQFVPKGARISFRSRVGVAVGSLLNFGFDIYEQ